MISLRISLVKSMTSRRLTSCISKEASFQWEIPVQWELIQEAMGTATVIVIAVVETGIATAIAVVKK